MAQPSSTNSPRLSSLRRVDIFQKFLFCWFRMAGMNRKKRERKEIKVVMALGIHLFPFRTEKLSPITPMVLHNSGRVGSRRIVSARSTRRQGAGQEDDRFPFFMHSPRDWETLPLSKSPLDAVKVSTCHRQGFQCKRRDAWGGAIIRCGCFPR